MHILGGRIGGAKQLNIDCINKSSLGESIISSLSEKYVPWHVGGTSYMYGIPLYSPRTEIRPWFDFRHQNGHAGTFRGPFEGNATIRTFCMGRGTIFELGAPFSCFLHVRLAYKKQLPAPRGILGVRELTWGRPGRHTWSSVVSYPPQNAETPGRNPNNILYVGKW